MVVYGGPYLLELLKSAERGSGRASPSAEKSNSASDNNMINISAEPEENFDGLEVDYTDHGFEPAKLKLQAGSKFGCLLKIKNGSKQDLTVRLGPYEKTVLDNYGQKYSPIPPGKYMIIDPLFNLRQEEFLNFYQPGQKFKLEIDQSCLPSL